MRQKYTHNQTDPAQHTFPFSHRLTMFVSLVVFVFIILSVTILFVGLLTILLYQNGLFENGRNPHALTILFGLLIVSVVIGTALAALFGKGPLRPLGKLIEATKQIAAGNFDVRVEFKGPREVLELANSFNTMAKELSSIETLRTDFVNNVSHEFKTPVSSILGFARLLQKNTISEADRNEYLGIIVTESLRLQKMASNVLTLSKLDNQQIAPESATFLLDEQLRQMILLLEPQWKKKHLTMDVDLHSVKYTGNEELLCQVWINLLDNAIKFSPIGATVEISLQVKEGVLEVAIADYGIGMDEETKEHLFDRFYQSDKSRSTEGNGLGLSLVYRILQLYGGEISVDSTQSEGSCFTIKLPLKAAI